jgi:hypothetical protein
MEEYWNNIIIDNFIEHLSSIPFYI